ncbi:hypothetical protein EU537_02100 [Candidatus Thorarchaeota archaeon]|nr:MAG: hypothetical protein EU537_02100 [Candidatus Thorarchaeota archaeon]
MEEAANRVLAALDQEEIQTVNTNHEYDHLIYQTARIMTEKIGNPRLKMYQAEAESKMVNKHLRKEPADFVIRLASDSFDWGIKPIGEGTHKAKLPYHIRTFDLDIRFENYLEVAPSFHSAEWKLVNRHVKDGWLAIKQSELNRLISGKFKKLILDSSINIPSLPSNLTLQIQRIESELKSKIRSTRPIEITENMVSAFPPCMAQMHSDSVQGKNLSHEARFALAAFLLKIGMTEEEVLSVFQPAPDFGGGQLAKYQVHHIASKGGEGYTPPSCQKMQGNTLCPVYLGAAFDPLCEYILHPLQFYQTRAWEISNDVENRSWYAEKKEKKQSF